MKKTVFTAAVVLASAVMTAPLAVASAAEPADCAAATIALTSAQSEHQKAVDADKALSDAEAADDAVEDAQQERDSAAADLAPAFRTLDAARTERARVQGELDKDTVVGDERAALERQMKRLNRYIKSEQDLADAQRKADKTDVADLRRKADKTDAEALKKVLDAAQDDVNRLCGGVTTTPPTPTPAPAPEEDLDCADFPLSSGRTAQQVLDETPGEDPHGLDADGDRRACEPGQDTAADGSDVGDTAEPVGDVATPSGGVSTGVGPA